MIAHGAFPLNGRSSYQNLVALAICSPLLHHRLDIEEKNHSALMGERDKRR